MLSGVGPSLDDGRLMPDPPPLRRRHAARRAGNRGTVTRRCPGGCTYTAMAARWTRCPRCRLASEAPQAAPQPPLALPAPRPYIPVGSSLRLRVCGHLARTSRRRDQRLCHPVLVPPAHGAPGVLSVPHPPRRPDFAGGLLRHPGVAPQAVRGLRPHHRAVLRPLQGRRPLARRGVGRRPEDAAVLPLRQQARCLPLLPRAALVRAAAAPVTAHAAPDRSTQCPLALRPKPALMARPLTDQRR